MIRAENLYILQRFVGLKGLGEVFKITEAQKATGLRQAYVQENLANFACVRPLEEKHKPRKDALPVRHVRTDFPGSICHDCTVVQNLKAGCVMREPQILALIQQKKAT